MEAIKLGSATVGLVNKTHAVVVGLKRNAEELGSYQRKIIKIDEHIGVSIAGLSPDARVLSNFMRQQAMSSKFTFTRPIPVSRLVNRVTDKLQANTQVYGRRPYGVGMLVIGVDDTGPHLYELLPNGSGYEYFAASLGARSQSSRTYLERELQSYKSSEGAEPLIMSGLKALRESLPQGKELTWQNTSIGVVGPNELFKIIDDEDVTEWLDQLGQTGRSTTTAPAQDEAPTQEEQAMSSEQAETLTAAPSVSADEPASDSATAPEASEAMQTDD